MEKSRTLTDDQEDGPDDLGVVPHVGVGLG